jgi:2-oxoglutarate dehydrogenase dihydrolipoamide succinyltransferase (E2 component)
MADVEMPQLGETVTEGTITQWFKAVGDRVEVDEPLFEVSTDKVDSEVPSPAAGVLAEILVPEGETVDVGTKLAVLSDGEGDGAEAKAEAEPEAEEEREAEEEPEAEPEAKEEAPEEPEAEPEAKEEAPEEPEAQAAPEPEAAEEQPEPEAADQGGDGKVLSPLVRRLIRKHELDPASISGTGPGGRITRKDVEAAAESGAARAAPASAPAPAAPARAEAPAAEPVAVKAAADGTESVALNNIRKRTGEHMVRSKQTSPHVLTAVEVDFEAVEQVRRAHQKAWKDQEGFSLTYLPFVARAIVDAIEEYPHLNASMGEGELLVHHAVHLAIAVDLSFEGLLAPVVRNAESKRLRAISREIRDLADRARQKKLSADEIAGGTFTITNPGQYGTLLQFPVINQPQVAILSTDGVHRRPVVVTTDDGSEAIAIHSVGVLALAWDHRAFDGAYAAAFLATLREIIETRDWEAEL